MVLGKVGNKKNDILLVMSVSNRKVGIFTPPLMFFNSNRRPVCPIIISCSYFNILILQIGRNIYLTLIITSIKDNQCAVRISSISVYTTIPYG